MQYVKPGSGMPCSCQLPSLLGALPNSKNRAELALECATPIECMMSIQDLPRSPFVG